MPTKTLLQSLYGILMVLVAAFVLLQFDVLRPVLFSMILASIVLVVRLIYDVRQHAQRPVVPPLGRVEWPAERR